MDRPPTRPANGFCRAGSRHPSELIAQTSPGTGGRRKDGSGASRHLRARIFRNFQAQSAAAPVQGEGQTVQHEHDTFFDRKRALASSFVRPSPGVRRQRVCPSRRRAAGSPVASNPRCAAAAQSRGLFSSERPLAARSANRQCSVHRAGRRIDRRRRRICRTGVEWQVRDEQCRSGTGCLRNARSDLRRATPPLRPADPGQGAR